jgi:hypothetical protein
VLWYVSDGGDGGYQKRYIQKRTITKPTSITAGLYKEAGGILNCLSTSVVEESGLAGQKSVNSGSAEILLAKERALKKCTVSCVRATPNGTHGMGTLAPDSIRTQI